MAQRPQHGRRESPLVPGYKPAHFDDGQNPYWLRRLSRGDEQVDFAALYRRFAPQIRELILRWTGDEDAANEITQDTFTEAFGSRHTIDPTRPIWPWLQTIMRHRLGRWFARQEAAVIEPLVEQDHPSMAAHYPHPSADPADLVLARDLAVLGPILPRYRRVLVLKYLAGLPYGDIGRIEGIGYHGVVTLLRRAREAARLARESGREQLGLVLGQLGFLYDRLRARLVRSAHTATDVRLVSDVLLSKAAPGFALIVGILVTVAGPFWVSEPPRHAIEGARRVLRAGELPQATSAGRLGPQRPLPSSSLRVTTGTPDALLSVGIGSEREPGRRSLRRANERRVSAADPYGSGSGETEVMIECDAGMTGALLCRAIDALPDS